MDYEVISYIDEFTTKFLIKKNVTLSVGDVIRACPEISLANHLKSVPLYTLDGDAFVGFVTRNRLNRDVYNWIRSKRYVEIKVLEIQHKESSINKVIISVFFKRKGYQENTSIAGLKFHINQFQNIHITNDQELIFLREPDNQHDSYAVAIYLANNTNIGKLGYLPRGSNSFFFEYIKDGGIVNGKIEKVIKDSSSDEVSYISINVICN
jgi:hypothetical protein